MESKGDPLDIALGRCRFQKADPYEDIMCCKMPPLLSWALTVVGFLAIWLQAITLTSKKGDSSTKQGGIECQKEMCWYKLFSLNIYLECPHSLER